MSATLTETSLGAVDTTPVAADGPLRIDVVPAGALTGEQIDAWSQIQRANAELCSPLFRPEFTLAVANLRDDVEVALLTRGGAAVGFFPFHRCAGGVARPVGFSLSDYHGVIASASLDFDAKQLLRDSGLKAWHFDHLPTAQVPFVPFHWYPADSPYIDLARGFDHYQQQRRAAGSDTVKQVLRKIRKIEREVGPLEFVPFTTDDQLFETLIEWKIAQYREIRSVNHLAEPWRIELLKSIVHTTGENFCGMMSGLWAGKHLLAVHLGMQSGGVLHCWFPTYSDEFAKYSPGLIFWIRLAQEAQSLGLHRIDLGKGPERYKRSLMTGATPLAEGSVDRRPVTGLLRRAWLGVREWIRNSPLKKPIQRVVRGIRALATYRRQG